MSESAAAGQAVVRVTHGRGRLRVWAVATRAGRDLCVIIAGGSEPHVGAVAVAQARPSLADAARTSATSSVLTLLGHKDDAIARAAAERLAAALGCTAVVSAGLHVDAATDAELEVLQMGAQRCVEDLLAALTNG